MADTTGKDLLVRALDESDIPQVAAFEAEIAVISFGEEAVADPAQHVAKLQRALGKGDDIMLVLAEPAQVLGWLWISLNTNAFTGDRYANFRSFALHPRVRGGQAGERLFAAGLERVKQAGGIGKMVGKVHVDNLPMRLLYKQLGFKPVHLTMELALEERSLRNERCR